MTITRWTQLALLAVVTLFSVSVFVAWRAMRRDQAQLQATLKSAQQALATATVQQQSRNAELEKQLAEIQKEKAAAKTPQEILKAFA
jgi:uncharacterized protein YpmS